MVKMFKSWAQFVDTMFVFIFGYSFIDLITISFFSSYKEIFTSKFIGNVSVTVIGLIFGVLRLIDYLCKRKIQKEINENERIASVLKREREERLIQIDKNDETIKKILE